MPVRDIANKLVVASVEHAMGVFKLAGKASVGAARLYNTIAEQLPIPLPRIPDGSAYDAPGDTYTPPPAPSRPEPVAKAPTKTGAPKNISTPKDNGAPTSAGIKVEAVGSKEEYAKSRAATTKKATAKPAAKKATAKPAAKKATAKPAAKKATAKPAAKKTTAKPAKKASAKPAAKKSAAKPATKKTTASSATEDLAKLTKAQLQAKLKGLGITFTTKDTKAALIAKFGA
ncbi:MAG: hypothetical protein VX223_15135 [Myxococcota bacterium]|nr:hypothetical protein [Myxococcota bacterium]